MHKTRCISTGGMLRQYLKELEQEPDDLIGKNEEVEEEKFKIIFILGGGGKLEGTSF